MKCLREKFYSSIPKAPMLMNTLPLTSLAKGGLFLDEVTTISPKSPALQSAGKLVSSKGQSMALVRQKGCLKYVSKFSCMIQMEARPALFSSIQLRRSRLIISILMFSLPDSWMNPGLLVKCMFFCKKSWLYENLGWGIGQQVARSSVEGMKTRSISSKFVAISCLINFICSTASSSKVFSRKPFRTLFLELRSGPMITTQLTLSLSFSFRYRSSLIMSLSPMLSFDQLFISAPLTKRILQAELGQFVMDLDALTLVPRSQTASNLQQLSDHETSMSAIMPTQTVPDLIIIFSFPVSSQIMTRVLSSLATTLRTIFERYNLSLTLPLST